jgi:putative DNA primase/helicase
VQARRATEDGFNQDNVIDAAEIFAKAPDEKPVITLGNLSANATDGERALIEAGVEIYEHCGKLVRPITETAPAAHERTTRVARLEEIGPVYLRDLLARHAAWQVYVARDKKMVRKDPPMDIAKTILARVGEWTFRAITGVVSTPTMRPDGTLLLEPGYDQATGMLLVDPPKMPEIPAKPSRDDAMQALAVLEDLLSEFPFADTFSESVALSALITPIARGAFTVAPLHALSATAAGSGKSYLADVVAAIAIGQPMPVIVAGRTEEETEKRLGAALMAGQPLISIDNVTNGLGGDALCVAVERPSAKMRVLGHSKQVQVNTRGTTFFATGNNLVIVGDMCRRTTTGRIDPRVERPELRPFKGDPVAKVLANRGAYIAACLTICRAYAVAKRRAAKRLASFEGWSDTVRSALIWLDKADPVDTMELERELDPVRIELRAMLSAWGDAIGVGSQHRCKLAEVIEAAKGHADLAQTIELVAGKPKANAQSLGLWLRDKRGTVIDGRRFDAFTNKKGGSVWWIEEV